MLLFETDIKLFVRRNKIAWLIERYETEILELRGSWEEML